MSRAGKDKSSKPQSKPKAGINTAQPRRQQDKAEKRKVKGKKRDKDDENDVNEEGESSGDSSSGSEEEYMSDSEDPESDDTNDEDYQGNGQDGDAMEDEDDAENADEPEYAKERSRKTRKKTKAKDTNKKAKDEDRDGDNSDEDDSEEGEAHPDEDGESPAGNTKKNPLPKQECRNYPDHELPAIFFVSATKESAATCVFCRIDQASKDFCYRKDEDKSGRMTPDEAQVEGPRREREKVQQWAEQARANDGLQNRMNDWVDRRSRRGVHEHKGTDSRRALLTYYDLRDFGDGPI